MAEAGPFSLSGYAGRGPTVGPRAVVSAGDPLAASAALEVLASGGNAIDAALAGALVQCVVEPPWCSIGGDAFFLVAGPGGECVALNGSGAAPGQINEAVAEGERAPRFGPLSVAVPGFVGAWFAVHGRFASRPAAELFAPAVYFARFGFPLDPGVAAAMARMEKELDEQARTGLAPLFARTPRRAGARLVQPELAESLELVAAGGAAAFYEGDLGRRLCAALARRGGVLAPEDLAAHKSEFVAPLSLDLGGRRVLANPPVSVGALLLEELAIAEGLSLSGLGLGSAELIDKMVFCKQAAFADAGLLGDPAEGLADPARLFSPERAAAWRRAYAPGRGAGRVEAPEDFSGGDTTSLAVTDAAGFSAVCIHSVFNEFGAREVAAGTGVLLNDRLAGLVADQAARNGLAPGRRPVHTLNTYMVLEDDVVVLAGATPGGRGQVQTNFQVLTGVFDFGLDPQGALDQARWLSGTPRTPRPDEVLYLESGVAGDTVAGLVELGYEVVVVEPSEVDGSSDFFGGCTVVGRDPETNALLAAADSRRRVTAVAW